MADLFQDAMITELRKSTMIAAINGGKFCPCCDQYVKVYRRSITNIMAKMLIEAYNNFSVDDYFHVSEVSSKRKTGGGDFAKLRYWGFIKAKPHDDGQSGKKHSGYWRITPFGVSFVRGELKVHKYALIYNGNFKEFEGESVSIRECLGEKFDYNELMEM